MFEQVNAYLLST